MWIYVVSFFSIKVKGHQYRSYEIWNCRNIFIFFFFFMRMFFSIIESSFIGIVIVSINPIHIIAHKKPQLSSIWNRSVVNCFECNYYYINQRRLPLVNGSASMCIYICVCVDNKGMLYNDILITTLHKTYPNKTATFRITLFDPIDYSVKVIS